MKLKAWIVGDDKLIASIGMLPDKMKQSMEQTVTRLSLKLVRHVKEDKLSDQVLHVRSGRLRRSINQRVDGSGTSNVTGTVGTNVAYGAAHEYGFHGAVQVRGYARKTPHGQMCDVRAFVRNVNLPERSFLRSALNDMKDEIMTELAKALNSAATEALKP